MSKAKSVAKSIHMTFDYVYGHRMGTQLSFQRVPFDRLLSSGFLREVA